MDINRFTEKVQQALSAAQNKAVRYGHQQIDVEHVLEALLEQDKRIGDNTVRHEICSPRISCYDHAFPG